MNKIYYIKRYWFILPILLIAAGLRIYNLEQKNLWFDEVYSWKISQGTPEQIIIDTSGDIHPPLYYIVLKYWIEIFSDSIFSMRMLSTLLSTVSLVLLFFLSKIFISTKWKLALILLLYCFSPLNIYYSQEVRMLNLNLLLCLSGVIFFYKFIKTNSAKYGAAYALFTLLSLYTHYFAFLILFTEAVIIFFFAFLKNKNIKLIKKYLIFFISINIFYLPWYPVFFSQISRGQPWRKQYTLPETGNEIINFFREIFLSSYWGFETMSVDHIATITAVFTIILLMYFLIKFLNQMDLFKDMGFSVSLFFYISLLIAIIISFNQSILFSRYLSITLPYLFIIIVYFSFRFFSSKIAAAIVILFIVVSCYGTYIYFNNHFKNNDYRRIISYLEKNINENDKIIVEPHYMSWGIDYYLKHNRSNLSTPEIFGWNLNMQIDSLTNRSDIRNVWILLDYSSMNTSGFDSLSIKMSERGFQRKNQKDFYLIPYKVRAEYFYRVQ